MFKFRKKEKDQEKKYKGTNLYITKYENEEVETLLGIIVSCIEGYVYQEHTMPDKLILSKNNFDRINEYNEKIIENKNNSYYTFGVEVEVKEV